MATTNKLIATRLAPLIGLEVSHVNHAADMLTLGFGPLRDVKNFKGVAKQVAQWALHVQCAWSLDRTGNTQASREDLYGSDEKANQTVNRLYELLVEQEPASVEKVSANDAGGIVVSLSKGLSLSVISDGRADDEGWRFFETGVDAAHLVIRGGAVDPESFDSDRHAI